MTVKERLLALLTQRQGRYISGEELGQALQVSRTAVWKAIKTLQSEGYNIAAGTNKGYCLAADTDVLSNAGVEKYLAPAAAQQLRICVQRTVSSTNTVIKQYAAAAETQGLVVIADTQTAGRGRLGRQFYSPAGTGIYMSLLLRPQLAAEKAQLITTAAAVALAQAIDALAPVHAQIKWVNDIFINGKKTCGILTEAAFNIENGTLDYAVLGIGINAYTPLGGYPPEIGKIAASVFTAPAADLRNRLAAEVLNRFMPLYTHLADKAYLAEYRARSCVVGKPVLVVQNGVSTPAVATGIDDDLHLLVQYENGEKAALSTGEISIRLQK